MRRLQYILAPTFIRKAAATSPLVVAAFYVAVAFFVFCAMVGVTAATFHLILNVTPSLPQGWYVQSAYRHGVHNEIVSVCESPAAARLPIDRAALAGGNCTNGDIPLLKMVVGYAGDVVRVTPRSVSVNGVRLPHSADVGVDRFGRRLRPAVGVYHLHAGQVWLYTPHTHSFDSRYYGPVSETLFREAARPFWTYTTKEFDTRWFYAHMRS